MKTNRLASIDIVRALTMLLMIVVNDLWSLTDIPTWLKHTSAEEDGMGLSDVVFPAFLFIVGLSIPHAIKARLQKGNSKKQVVLHILSRAFALIVMGLYVVNFDSINAEQLILRRAYWEILMALAFVLIWNNYQQSKIFGVIPNYVFKIAGWAILVFLACNYQSTSGEWMTIQWWGILGLIGWAYLLCATCYLLVGNQISWIAIITIPLLLLNINEFVQIGGLDFKIVVSASNHVSVMFGVLVTVIFQSLSSKDKLNYVFFIVVGLAISLLAFGLITRPFWGISKILATPSWTAICGAISIGLFLMLYYITDIKGIQSWAKPIAAAGYSTLTCYLIPYFVYALIELLGWQWPEMLSTGIVGLVKSLVFAFLIIQLTRLLKKADISLKI